MEPVEVVEDTLNVQGLEGLLNARKDRNEVRELEKWKKKMKRMRNGQEAPSNADFELSSFLKSLKHLNDDEREQLVTTF